MSRLTPTYQGYIATTKDALLVIQAALDLRLPTVPRRPQDKERAALITLGNVFVFTEESSGVKRWTDGVSWSPLRILGRFLIYRELDGTADKKARPKKKNKPTEVPNRLLVGLLVALYAFKECGLVKKTMSLTINTPTGTQTVHLILYYSTAHVMENALMKPLADPKLRGVHLSPELWAAVKDLLIGGKMPVEDETYYYLENNRGMNNNTANMVSGMVGGQILYFNPLPHQQPQTFLPPLTHMEMFGQNNGMQSQFYTPKMQPFQWQNTPIGAQAREKPLRGPYQYPKVRQGPQGLGGVQDGAVAGGQTPQRLYYSLEESVFLGQGLSLTSYYN